MKCYIATLGFAAALSIPGLALAAGVSDSPPGVTASSKTFVTDAIKGDNSEIMLGQLAQKQSQSSDVKSFGQTLVADHTKAKQEMVDLAGTLGVTPPTEATTEAQNEKDKLSGMSGKDFDHEFASFMVKDHKKDIQKFKKEANANDGKASDLAKQQLPTLQKHLRMAQSLEKNGQLTQ